MSTLSHRCNHAGDDLGYPIAHARPLDPLPPLICEGSNLGARVNGFCLLLLTRLILAQVTQERRRAGSFSRCFKTHPYGVSAESTPGLFVALSEDPKGITYFQTLLGDAFPRGHLARTSDTWSHRRLPRAPPLPSSFGSWLIVLIARRLPASLPKGAQEIKASEAADRSSCALSPPQSAPCYSRANRHRSYPVRISSRFSRMFLSLPSFPSYFFSSLARNEVGRLQAALQVHVEL